MNRDAMRDKLLELCQEDYYGVWELWWAVSQKVETPSLLPELMNDFVEVVSRLVEEGKLIAGSGGFPGKKFVQNHLDKQELFRQIRNSREPNASFYSFGAT